MQIKYLAAFQLLLFNLYACNDTDYVCNDPNADLTAPAYYDVNDLKQSYQTFWKPSNGWVGDPMPLYDNGKYHVFYLHDARDGAPTFHPWAKVETSDFYHWQDNGEVISCGADNSQEDALGTGSVIKAGNLYYAFYTAHNRNLNPAEKIYMATSTDLQNWTKNPAFELQAPDGYDANEFRDPFLMEENGVYKMLISSRGYVKAVNDWQAVIMQYSSTDMLNWTLEEPFYYNGERMLECADVFTMNGYQYLIYSNWDWAEKNRRVLYRYRPIGGEEWIIPQRDDLDQFAYYAGKTAGDGEKRYLFGWTPTRTDANDNSAYSWAGALVVHELKQQADGTLQVDIPAPLSEQLSAPVKPALLRKNGVAVTGDDYRLSGKDAYAWFDRVAGVHRIRATIKPVDAVKFGFELGVAATAQERMRLSFDMEQKTVRLEKISSGQLSAVMATLDLEFPEDGQFRVEMVIEHSVCVLYINGKQAFSNRIYRMSHNPWRIFSDDGTVTFEGLTVSKGK